MTPLSACGIVGKGKRGVAMAMLTHEWHQRPVSQQTRLQSWMLLDAPVLPPRWGTWKGGWGKGVRYLCVSKRSEDLYLTHTCLDNNTHKCKYARVEKALP